MAGDIMAEPHPLDRKHLKLSYLQSFAFWIAVAVLFLSLSAQADVLYLENGNSMEGVVVEEGSQQVRIKLAFGELTLPRSSVRYVERAESALELYLREREALQGSPNSTARNWLELAFWATQNDLDHSSREAALEAARLDPALEGLAPLLMAHGYALDEELGQWVPLAEMMRRRGYVEQDGRWVAAAELAAIKRASFEAAESRRAQREHDRLARAMGMLVVSQIVQAEEMRRQRDQALLYGALPIHGGVPIAVFPGVWPGAPKQLPHRAARHHTESGGRTGEAGPARAAHQRAVLSRPPGSLIPVSPPRVHHQGGLLKAGSD